MSDPIKFLTRGLAAALLAATTASAPAAPSAPVAPSRPAVDWIAVLAQDAPPAPCCFSNPAYSGTCEVTPGKDETCGSILGYLNNPMSQGKDYCGNTTIRGGWKTVSCAPK